MVSIAYDALALYATWSAWLKVWISTKLFGDIWLLRSILKYLASGDRRILEALEDVPTPPFDRVMRANVNFADAQIQAACHGRFPTMRRRIESSRACAPRIGCLTIRTNGECPR